MAFKKVCGINLQQGGFEINLYKVDYSLKVFVWSHLQTLINLFEKVDLIEEAQ